MLRFLMLAKVEIFAQRNHMAIRTGTGTGTGEWEVGSGEWVACGAALATCCSTQTAAWPQAATEEE